MMMVEKPTMHKLNLLKYISSQKTSGIKIVFRNPKHVSYVSVNLICTLWVFLSWHQRGSVFPFMMMMMMMLTVIIISITAMILIIVIIMVTHNNYQNNNDIYYDDHYSYYNRY